jgi:ferrous-iron efflux pump FieF
MTHAHGHGAPVEKAVAANHFGAAGAQMRRVTRVSLATALTLTGLKLLAWHFSGSVSLLASAIDSGLDAVASGLTAWAVGASLEPADEEHRFGHGKLEPLAGLAQALLVATSALGLLQQSWQRLSHPEPITGGPLGLAVMGIASLATVLLIRYQRKVAAATGSTAVAGDALHYASDLLMNAAVIVALIASTWLGLLWVDPVLGLVVTGIVARSAWQIGNEAVHLLMDREMPPEDRLVIEQLALAVPGVQSLHKVRTRRAGLQVFVELHLDVAGDLPLREAHEIGQVVSRQIEALHPGADVLVHLDPV